MKSMLKAAETAIHTYVSPDVQVTITAESKQAARPEVWQAPSTSEEYSRYIFR